MKVINRNSGRLQVRFVDDEEGPRCRADPSRNPMCGNGRILGDETLPEICYTMIPVNRTAGG